jgi:hypothetical protein
VLLTLLAFDAELAKCNDSARRIAQLHRQFDVRVSLLILAFFVVARPLTELASNIRPDSSLVALAERLLPLDASLQSIRPDLSQSRSPFSSSERLFPHLSYEITARIEDSEPLRNLAAANHARLLASFRAGRSPPYESC